MTSTVDKGPATADLLSAVAGVEPGLLGRLMPSTFGPPGTGLRSSMLEATYDLDSVTTPVVLALPLDHNTGEVLDSPHESAQGPL